LTLAYLVLVLMARLVLVERLILVWSVVRKDWYSPEWCCQMVGYNQPMVPTKA
jgi:hypothetical protein